MQLDTFSSDLARRNAQQAVLVSGQPMRVLIGGKWSSGAATPSDGLLDAMLQNTAPNANTRENSFEARAGGERFQVRVTTQNGARIIVLTRLDASGAPLASEETALSAFAPAVAVPKPTDFDRARGAAPSQTPLVPPRKELPPLTPNEMFPPPIAAPLATVPPPIPGALIGEWYHAVGGQEVGPFPAKTMMRLIETNVVRSDTIVWQQGMTEWKMAKSTELANFFSTRSSSASSFKPFVNDSGTGKLATLPAELEGYNRGAIMLPWWWCVAHKAWVDLAMWSLGPIVFLITAMLTGDAFIAMGSLTLFSGPIFMYMLFRFGYSANQTAWRNRKWDSIEHFKKVQGEWIRFGWFGVLLTLMILGATTSGIAGIVRLILVVTLAVMGILLTRAVVAFYRRL